MTQPRTTVLSPVSIQTQSLALRVLRKRKPQETQALALARSQSWLPLLRPSIPISWRLRLLRESLPTQALALLAIFVYATQAIAFEWNRALFKAIEWSASVVYSIECPASSL